MDTNDTQTRGQAPSVGKAWAWLFVFTGVMTAIGFIAWDSLSAAPEWFHALYAGQTIWAIVGVVSAHKRRTQWEEAQAPE